LPNAQRQNVTDCIAYHSSGIGFIGGIRSGQKTPSLPTQFLSEIPAHATRIDSWPIRAAPSLAVFDPSGIHQGRLLLPLCGEQHGIDTGFTAANLIYAETGGR
jgi:hypothetical protein